MYTMKECSELTGLSYDTLKFYCKKGLVPNIKRNKNNNYRLFDEDDISWIKSLICLKKCGLSLKEMNKFIDLCMQGKSTILERKEILLNHRKQLNEQIISLKESINFIDKKNGLYDKFLSGEIEYYSYFIKTNKN